MLCTCRLIRGKRGDMLPLSIDVAKRSIIDADALNMDV